MAWPGGDNVERAAEAISTALQRLRAETAAMRPDVASNEIDSLRIKTLYETAIEVRSYVGARIGMRGLLEAMRRRYADSPDFDPVAEWVRLSVRIDSLIEGLAMAMPRDGQAHVTFHRIGASGALESFPVTLSTPAHQALMQRLQNLIDAFG